MQQGLLIIEVSLRVHVVQRSGFTVCTYVCTLYVCVLCAYWQVHVCLYYILLCFLLGLIILCRKSVNGKLVCIWECVFIWVCLCFHFNSDQNAPNPRLDSQYVSRCMHWVELHQACRPRKYSKLCELMVTRCKNATQRNARIGSEFILVLYCVVNTKATQKRRPLYCIVNWALTLKL